MNPIRNLHNSGQRIWLDNITRELLNSGTLSCYIKQLFVTGLTSNPTIFHNAINKGNAYDESILVHALGGKSGEALFFELALEDLTRAADLFRPIYDASEGLDGWVSLEVSPLLADDAASTIEAAIRLYTQAGRPNFFIKIPGNRVGASAIEEVVFAGVPVNVTLLFSEEHYLAAADAYMRGIERRIASGLDPKVRSVASVFVSRWDLAVQGKTPPGLNNCLAIAIAKNIYKAYRNLYESARWHKLYDSGACQQTLLWASTGTKDPGSSDTLYIEALVAPDTISTMPEKTLLAFSDHGKVEGILPVDGGDAGSVLAAFNQAGIQSEELASDLQRQGIDIFAKSWNDLVDSIREKSDILMQSK